MQIRGEYPAEPPPAYEDPRHHVSTSTFDSPPPSGAIAEAPRADETPSTERSGLLGELLDRFSEPDSDINQQQQQRQQQRPPNPPPIGDHKIQTDGPHHQPTGSQTPSHSIPQQDRKRCMSTGSKPLSGTFPLYDSLALTTHSGPLTGTVKPEPANPVKPLPAELRVHSHSGSIRLDTRIPIPADDDDDDDAKRSSRAVWQREYRSAVTSHSSRIEARVVLGGKTLVQSHLGVLDVEAVIGPLDLAPQAGEGGRGQGQKAGKKAHKTCRSNPLSSPRALNLHTQTHSSSQNVRVVELCTTDPNSGASYIARLPQQQQQQQQQQVLTTTHHTHSGKLQLHYPGTWTGKIEGTMGKAKAEITIHGMAGVDVIQQTPHRFLAKRRRTRYQRDEIVGGGQDGAGAGEEEEEGGGMPNTLRFYSFSGAVEIFFG
ncbi:hypothetical protein NU219Hw_g8499t1 [Hortaea werneckii]